MNSTMNSVELTSNEISLSDIIYIVREMIGKSTSTSIQTFYSNYVKCRDYYVHYTNPSKVMSVFSGGENWTPSLVLNSGRLAPFVILGDDSHLPEIVNCVNIQHTPVMVFNGVRNYRLNNYVVIVATELYDIVRDNIIRFLSGKTIKDLSSSDLIDIVKEMIGNSTGTSIQTFSNYVKCRDYYVHYTNPSKVMSVFSGGENWTPSLVLNSGRLAPFVILGDDSHLPEIVNCVNIQHTPVMIFNGVRSYRLNDYVVIVATELYDFVKDNIIRFLSEKTISDQEISNLANDILGKKTNKKRDDIVIYKYEDYNIKVRKFYEVLYHPNEFPNFRWESTNYEKLDLTLKKAIKEKYFGNVIILTNDDILPDIISNIAPRINKVFIIRNGKESFVCGSAVVVDFWKSHLVMDVVKSSA